MGRTCLASGLRLGALVATLWLGTAVAAAASGDGPAGGTGGADSDGERLAIHWFTPARLPDEGLLTKLEPKDSDRLDAFFERQGFRIASVRDGLGTVPRVVVTRLPDDLERLRRTERRKRLFLRSVLPLVLLCNEELRSDRGRLLGLHERQRAGDPLSAGERAWLAGMAERYGTDAGDLKALLLRVDAVPVSLTLGQAILESGWGTSRFARDGNALFGETVTSSQTPHLLKRDGSRKRFRAFPSLMASVRAYMHNLNTHRAYREFRSRRAAQRVKGGVLSGRQLLPTLSSYAELPGYLDLVSSLIRSNRLEELESARLDHSWFASRQLHF